MHRSIILFGCMVLFGQAGFADVLVAARTVKANAVLSVTDIEMQDATTATGKLKLADVIGKEAVNVIFKGQSITGADLAEPALVERNQIILLIFQRGGLTIETEGRALERGRAGDLIRVMNLSSRSTVSGHVDPLGAVKVRN